MAPQIVLNEFVTTQNEEVPSQIGGINVQPSKFGEKYVNAPPGEKIVISGISGKFPESDNMHEFRDNLFNKADLTTEDDRRWSNVNPEIPKRSGKLNKLEKFDASFFGVHHRQAETMEPMIRMLLECSVEAIFDAGYVPKDFEGTKTGVFVGACFSESEQYWKHNLRSQSFIVTGSIVSEIAHRVSYYLKLSGPSHTADTACSSSFYALDCAYRAMRDGTCDNAIVAGVNILLHPNITLQFARLGVLSPEGRCKVFDVNGDGYVRAEAIGAILLQKSKDARRIYGEVVYVKTNCDGYKEQGITFPSCDAQKLLLTEFYQECNVKPDDLSYMEAHGTGTFVGDPEEVTAIDDIISKKRVKPLMIGSVKSNLGHSEPSAGICSLAKVIIAMESGIIPATINFTKAREGVDALESGRLQVLTENTPFIDDNGLVAVNSFGFGGANSHVLLRWNKTKRPNNGLPEDDVPRLVCVSGRVNEAVPCILDDIKNRPLNAEYIRLYHQIFSKNIEEHFYRGYSILTKSGEVERSVGYYSERKSLCLAFTDFDHAWQDIGNGLLILPQFQDTLQRIQNIVSNKKNAINHSTSEVFNQIMGSFSVQLAFSNLLKSLNFKPDRLVGCGFGEFACAHFEDVLTLEQAVNCVHDMSNLISEADKKSISYKIKVSKDEVEQLPKFAHITDISPDAITITGIEENLSSFVKNLSNQGIAVEQVISQGYIFINGNFNEIRDQLSQIIQEHVPTGKPKSSRWPTSSKVKEIDADYFLDSLKSNKIVLSTLSEHETILEIGCGHIKNSNEKLDVLDFNESEDIVMDLLKNLANLYVKGSNMEVDKLYPKIQYPVSRGTPMISSLIKWDHSKDWHVCYYKPVQNPTHQKLFNINLSDEKWAFIAGHVLAGRIIFPGIGYLCLAWDTLASFTGSRMNDMHIVLEDCKFHRASYMADNKTLQLLVMIQQATGDWVVTDNGAVVATGRIYVQNDPKQVPLDVPVEIESRNEDDIMLNQRDMYKELHLRGYSYTAEHFRRITECNPQITRGKIRWDGNWITFVDNIFQFNLVQIDTRSLALPISLKTLSINAKEHIKLVSKLGEDPQVAAYNFPQANLSLCGGVDLRGIKGTPVARKKQLVDPVLEKYHFVPNEAKLSLGDSIRVNMQIAMENLQEIKVKIVEVVDDNVEPLASNIHQTLLDLPLIQPDITVLSKKSMSLPNITVESKSLESKTECSIVIGSELLKSAVDIQHAFHALKPNGFVLSRENLDFVCSNLNEIDIVTVHSTENEKIIMARKATKTEDPLAIDVSDSEKLDWVPQVQKAIAKNSKLVLFAQNCPLSGILGLANCLRQESGGSKIQCVLTFKNAPEFDLNDCFYTKQLKKNLAANVYKNGQWGTYRHLQLEGLEQIPCDNAFINVPIKGDLSSLKWTEGPLGQDSCIPVGYTKVHIYYSALNFRDIMTATGRINVETIDAHRTTQDFVHGFEFSGRTPNGQRVCTGLVLGGGLATEIVVEDETLVPIPDDWSMEDAATISVCYGTVIFSLYVRTRIKKGDSILIHSGTGGIGQAAINIALFHGLTIFTTVGTEEKKEYIKKMFPQIPEENIGSSKDTSFEQMVLSRTKGRGVDFVLNSLAEEKLIASVRCLAQGGQFLEIGKFDLQSDHRLALMFMEKDANFHGIVNIMPYHDNPIKGSKSDNYEVMQCVIEHMKWGAVKPLERTVFDKEDVEKAFRYMTSGKHVGKVLVKLRDEEPEKVVIPSHLTDAAVPRYNCNIEKVSVVLGGLGGFGLELVDWLVLRGAKKIVISSRRGVTSGYQCYRLRVWRSYGVIVKISTVDVTTTKGCRQLLEEAIELGPVESIFNLAVVLRDALFENQTAETFRDSMGPKAYATQYLDDLSRQLCPELKHFVVFSSVSCGRGNAGQTNYGMSNSIMERICEKRKEDGLPAVAIEWGAIGDVGLVAEMQEMCVEVEIGGTLQQRISNCLEVLDRLLRQKNAIVSSMMVAERREAVGESTSVVEVVQNVLGIKNLKTISLQATFPELGMDSMTGIEIKQVLEREFDIILSTQDVRTMTFSKLQEIQDGKEPGNEVVVEVKSDMLHMIVKLAVDECVFNQHQIKLPSKSTNKQDTTVIFFPGIEGAAKTFGSLVSKLDINAISLQYCYEDPKETVTELVNSLIPIVESIISKSEPFNFVAYSYGGVIALEVVNILEKKGYKGNLLCIDTAPQLIVEVTKIHADTSSQAQFETSILAMCLGYVISETRILENKDKFLSCSTFEERLNLAMSLIPKDAPYNLEHLKMMTSSVCKRLLGVRKYEPTYKISSRVQLFKPTNMLMPGLAEDYKLSEICENVVGIKTVEGNHLSILESSDLAHAIGNIKHMGVKK